MRDPQIGIFLMQKNEERLLPVFVQYYGQLFGYENIHIIDNGSNGKVLKELQKSESAGCNVVYSHSKPEDFENKGKIISGYINENRTEYDVCFPLDCDEFIALRGRLGGFSTDRQAFLNYFEQLSSGAHSVRRVYRNHPKAMQKFYRHKAMPKLFFKDTVVTGLDTGFHSCKEPPRVSRSSIVYFEFHNKPFKELIDHAREKMELRLNDFSEETLSKFWGKGHHLIQYLQWDSEKDYENYLASKRWFHTDVIRNAFREASIDMKAFQSL